jgi:ubiquinone/menaquinone biosynthesis C-methylase UbiE
MLALARDNVKRAGLEARVRIVCADAKATGEHDAMFDMVMSNSLVHHIPDPVLFFQEAKRVASRAAALCIMDLHRPATEAEHQSLVERYAEECTDYQRRLFSDSLHAALTIEEVRAICDRVGFTDVDVCRTSDRHWCVKRPWSGAGERN